MAFFDTMGTIFKSAAQAFKDYMEISAYNEDRKWQKEQRKRQEQLYASEDKMRALQERSARLEQELKERQVREYVSPEAQMRLTTAASLIAGNTAGEEGFKSPKVYAKKMMDTVNYMSKLTPEDFQAAGIPVLDTAHAAFFMSKLNNEADQVMKWAINEGSQERQNNAYMSRAAASQAASDRRAEEKLARYDQKSIGAAEANKRSAEAALRQAMQTYTGGRQAWEKASMDEKKRALGNKYETNYAANINRAQSYIKQAREAAANIADPTSKQAILDGISRIESVMYNAMGIDSTGSAQQGVRQKQAANRKAPDKNEDQSNYLLVDGPEFNRRLKMYKDANANSGMSDDELRTAFIEELNRHRVKMKFY